MRRHRPLVQSVDDDNAITQPMFDLRLHAPLTQRNEDRTLYFFHFVKEHWH
ncbi:Uncharacterized protein ToN1_39770 [Aromatoleum petrolei]|nr:Uncharacterized protein ToN1_39770 [Aromatoleum petrolei]